MDNAEKLEKFLIPKLLFLYLIAFPFGQLLSIRFNLLRYNIPIHAADLIVALIALTSFLTSKAYPKIFAYIKHFILFLIVSFLFSLAIFNPPELIVGILYLLRLCAYTLFFISIYNFVKKSGEKKELLFSSLTYVTL